MLRITTDESSEPIRLRLEGKLTGPWVAELEQLYAARRADWGNKPLVVDIGNLTGVDAAGRYLLVLIAKDGVRFENANPLTAPLFGLANGFAKTGGEGDNR